MKEKFEHIIESIMERSEGGMNALLIPELINCNEEKMTSEIRYEAQEWEKNQRGELHGGAVAAMFDTAMGITTVVFSEANVATADISVSYIRPFLGKSFIFKSEIIHSGKSLVRISSRAYDEETGKCLASSTANFARISRAERKNI